MGQKFGLSLGLTSTLAILKTAILTGADAVAALGRVIFHHTTFPNNADRRKASQGAVSEGLRREEDTTMTESASADSPTPMETTETPARASGITQEQWRAMKDVIETIYSYREPE